MRIFLIRHADPDYANNTITPAGHVEAEALAKRMAALGLDRIYTSPLGRARDTAGYTARALGMVPVVLPWTAELVWKHIHQERLGDSVVWDIHGHVVHRHRPEPTSEDWHTRPPFDAPDYREGYAVLRAESDAFLSSLGYTRDGGVYRVGKSNRERIALFCHGGFGLTWLAHLLSVPLPLMWTGFFLPTTSVTTILFDERVEGFATPRCLGVGDVSHLYAAGLPMQPAGIKANRD